MYLCMHNQIQYIDIISTCWPMVTSKCFKCRFSAIDMGWGMPPMTDLVVGPKALMTFLTLLVILCCLNFQTHHQVPEPIDVNKLNKLQMFLNRETQINHRWG